MIHKITNPLAVGNFAPLIMKFFNRINESSAPGSYRGITYESLFTYITRVVQFGGDRGEFWVSFENDVPVAFAVWTVMDLPNIGKVCCDSIYNDTRNQRATKELYEEFINFGKRHRCPIYQIDAVNEKVGEHFKHVFEKLGVEASDSGIKNYIGRLKK